MNNPKLKNHIERIFAKSIEVKQKTLEENLSDILRIAINIEQVFRRHGKVVLFGNGGSASDAQHVAGEFVNRFLLDRQALPAIALTTDTSVITSIANDVGYDYIFARQVEALVHQKDVVIGISTSGNSLNVLKGINSAAKQGAKTIGLSGQEGGELRDLVDICICVPSDSTPRVQESHITILHTVCELVEKMLYGDY